MEPKVIGGPESTRRGFVKQSAAGVLAGAAVSGLVAPAVHAQGSDVIRVGLVGCGGRGSGAATDALSADPNAKLVAVGDAFADRLQSSLDQLRKVGGAQVDVKPDHAFVGFDAFRHVIEVSDVVLLCTPPHFRPVHVKAAIEAGKHVFCEKPVAVDAPGVRSVMATAELAKKKNLALVNGLCWRYHHGMQETIKRIHDGDIGEIVAMNTNYNVGGLWHKVREKGWTDMEYQIRNWLYFTWLSGDHNVEQHVHSLDKMAWLMKDQYPANCFGLGGRQARTQAEFGHIFDHHAVCYEFANGVKCFSYCRQQNNTHSDVSDHIYGTKGYANLMEHVVKVGGKEWRYKRPRKSPPDNMYKQEHDALFAAIRAGKPINNGDYMCKSTLMAIMGRMSTYTGQLITWEAALSSKEDLSPPAYEFGNLPTPSVAVPGVTKFS